MTRFRHTAAAIAGLVASVAGFVVAAPAAFAMRVIPPTGDASPATHTVVIHAGIAGWEIALITIAAALATAVVMTALRRARHHSPLSRVVS